MARKSRRNTDYTAVKAVNNSAAGKVYHAALYARISSEDERKRECESMENQVKLLRDYVGSCEDIAEYDLYMDRAVTGTMFDRRDREGSFEAGKELSGSRQLSGKHFPDSRDTVYFHHGSL